MLLAGLVWAERKQFSKASERAERRIVPDGRRESGKSTKLHRKIQTESLSEELLGCKAGGCLEVHKLAIVFS